MRAVVGDFDFEELRVVQPVYGPIIFSTFLIVVVFSLFNMFIAIISEAFDDTKKLIEESGDFDSSEFFEEFVRTILSISK